MSFYPSSSPQALLQSPGPSPGPFINRRHVRLPWLGTFAKTTPGGVFCGGEVPLYACDGSGRLAGRQEAESVQGISRGWRGHGLDGAGSRGPRAATAAVWALLVHGSSKLCASVGMGGGWGEPSHFLPVFSSPAQ